VSRQEPIAKLETLTNLRAIEDPDSPSGWEFQIPNSELVRAGFPHPSFEDPRSGRTKNAFRNYVN